MKIITGIQKCCEPKLFEVFIEYLLSQGIPEQQIIYINFEDLQYEQLCDYRKMHSFL